MIVPTTTHSQKGAPLAARNAEDRNDVQKDAHIDAGQCAGFQGKF
jgi:hypothetical protein